MESSQFSFHVASLPKACQAALAQVCAFEPEKERDFRGKFHGPICFFHFDLACAADGGGRQGRAVQLALFVS